MGKVQKFTDEELAKRSGRAGAALTVVAVLLTVLAIWAVWNAVQVELQAKPDSTESSVTLPWVCSWAQPLFLCLMAAALWPLAIAGKRGNPAALGTVLLVLAMQVLFSLSMLYSSLTQGGKLTDMTYPICLVVAMIVIAVAVFMSREVLLEMKRRGSWDATFASAKASSRLCRWGNGLLVVGYLGLVASLYVPMYAVKQEQTKRGDQVKAFLECIMSDEPGMLEALQKVTKKVDKPSLKTAIEKVEALDKKLAVIQRDIPDDAPLLPIVKKYRKALSDWRAGLSALNSPEPDVKTARELLQSGAAFRLEAVKEFTGKREQR